MQDTPTAECPSADGLSRLTCLVRAPPAQTAVKLQDGSVWLAASHPLTPSTLQTLSELGPIKHIVMVRRQRAESSPSGFLLADEIPYPPLPVFAARRRAWNVHEAVP